MLIALQTAINKMDNADVPTKNQHLFITSDLLIKAQNVDATESRNILGAFNNISKVPQKRFYTTSNLLDGKTSRKKNTDFKKDTEKKI